MRLLARRRDRRAAAIPSWWAMTTSPIYRWRGARVENLQQFRRDFPQRAAVPPRAELPLHRHHPRGRQRADRAQRRAPRQEPLDRAARAASRSTSIPPSTSATRRSSSRTASASGWRAAACGARSRSCTAPTRSRACSKRRSCPRACPTGLRRPALLRARRNQGRARLPAPDRQPPTTTPRSSASSTCPPRGIGAKSLDMLREHAQRRGQSRCGEAAGALRSPAAQLGRRRPRPRCTASCGLIERLAREIAGPARCTSRSTT